jgi:3-keto-L-gulonate-6-phosphate decarboxylase
MSKLYFFEYAGYGGVCYIVKADTLNEATNKLESYLNTIKMQTEQVGGINDDEVKSMLESGYEIIIVDKDIYETDYLGE